tara:strand:- start:97 stop:330 length:234 start_codon:yes stop_codon:yes gene_type:complete
MEIFNRDRDPFSFARQEFLAGRMHTTTAIGLVSRDRDFIAEAEMSGEEAVAVARRVVLINWRGQLAKSGQVWGVSKC